MKSFERSGAAKRRTSGAMPGDGVKVKDETSAEQEVGSQSPEKEQKEMDDLWLQLKRQTQDMENHIRRLASCENQDTGAEKEMSLENPQMVRMDIDEDLPISGWAGSSQDADGLRKFSCAGGRRAKRGVKVSESVGALGAADEATPKHKKMKVTSVAMAATEHPLLPAMEQPYRLAKQSGVPKIWWSCKSFAWQVQFPKLDAKGNISSWTNRQFAVKKFMVQGRSEAEADAEALEAAKAFRAELVGKGILSRPQLKDPNYTSEAPGVHWCKAAQKWKVQIQNRRKVISGGCFTEKAEAEAKALELREKHCLQLQVKPVPTLANRYAGLPVFHPKVPYPGVKWAVQVQKWHAQCLVGGARRNFMVKPKDHSEAELERSFKVAVKWRKKQEKAVAWKKKQEKEKKRKAVKPNAKPRKK